MGFYCGCGTLANKVKWSCLVIALISGVLLFRSYIFGLTDAFIRYNECMDHFKTEGKISQADYDKYAWNAENIQRRMAPDAPDPIGHTPNPYVNECENGAVKGLRTAVFCSQLGFLMFILAIVTAFVLCCCSSPPRTVNITGLDYQPILAPAAAVHTFASPSDRTDASLVKVV